MKRYLNFDPFMKRMVLVANVLLTLLILVLLASAIMMQPVYAADTVNASPLYNMVNQVLQEVLEGVAMAVSGWLMFVFHKYVTPWIGAQLEAKARDSLNMALANGVAIAMSKVEGAEQLHQNVAVKGAVTAWAAQYAVDHAPGAVAKFGLDPNQLALKALAYIPTPLTLGDITGVTVPQPATVQVEPLAPVKS